jgi:hypothetical protein
VRSAAAIAAADYGTLVHYWKETGEIDPAWAARKDVELLRRKLAATGVERETWWPAHGAHEESFAIRLESMTVEWRMLPKDAADKWKAQFDRLAYVTGTIDWHDAVEWEAHVDDLKTGRRSVRPDSPQLKTYAAALWLRRGKPAGVTASVTHWPKYPLGLLPVRTSKVLTAGVLRDHLDRLRLAAGSTGEINPGECCRWCDCRPDCPAWDGMK